MESMVRTSVSTRRTATSGRAIPEEMPLLHIVRPHRVGDNSLSVLIPKRAADFLGISRATDLCVKIDSKGRLIYEKMAAKDGLVTLKHKEADLSGVSR